jgi:hypothetical protein
VKGEVKEMGFLLLFVPVLFIIGLIFGFTALKKMPPEEGDIVIKNVYVYLVSFATLMMVIGGSVGAFMSAADLIAPQSYHASFEDFKNGKMVKDPSIPNQEQNINEEELKAEYEKMIESDKERKKQRALNGLIKSFGWIVIPLPIFFFFQRKIRKP